MDNLFEIELCERAADEQFAEEQFNPEEESDLEETDRIDWSNYQDPPDVRWENLDDYE